MKYQETVQDRVLENSSKRISKVQYGLDLIGVKRLDWIRLAINWQTCINCSLGQATLKLMGSSHKYTWISPDGKKQTDCSRLHRQKTASKCINMQTFLRILESLITDHSPPSSDEVKYAWSCTSTPPILHGVVVVKHRDTFTLPLLLPTNYEARH